MSEPGHKAASVYRVSKYPHGAFSWAENNSSEAEAAKAFYKALFGWDTVETRIGAGMTAIFQLHGADVCALSGMRPDQLARGLASHWNSFVTVDDVDALLDVVTGHGGAVEHGPDDVADRGRLLAIQDPAGARLNLWQPREHIGAGIVNTVGAMCWNELWTSDAAAAKEFYGALFGWEFAQETAIFSQILNRGRPNGGILQLDEGMLGLGSWQTGFSVACLDASLALAESLGGLTRIARHPAPGKGYFAWLEDPAGAPFYLFQLDKPAAWID